MEHIVEPGPYLSSIAAFPQAARKVLEPKPKNTSLFATGNEVTFSSVLSKARIVETFFFDLHHSEKLANASSSWSSYLPVPNTLHRMVKKTSALASHSFP